MTAYWPNPEVRQCPLLRRCREEADIAPASDHEYRPGFVPRLVRLDSRFAHQLAPFGAFAGDEFCEVFRRCGCRLGAERGDLVDDGGILQGRRMTAANAIYELGLVSQGASACDGRPLRLL